MKKTKAGRKEGVSRMSGASKEATKSLLVYKANGALQTSRDLVFIWVRWERHWRDLGVRGSGLTCFRGSVPWLLC